MADKTPVNPELLEKLKTSASKLTDVDVEALLQLSERMHDMNIKVSVGSTFSTMTFTGANDEVDASYKEWKSKNPDVQIICAMVARHPKKKGAMLIKANFIRVVK